MTTPAARTRAIVLLEHAFDECGEVVLTRNTSAMRKSDRDIEPGSPIVFVPCSNGERLPPMPTARDQHAERLYQRLAEEKAKRLGMSRRQFAASACGAATALLVIIRRKIREDDVAKLRTAALDLPPSRHLGPRTRRELFAMLRG
jgi:hypothetical protein